MSGRAGVRLGVEEEFHVVDLQSREAAPEVEALLAELDGAWFARELQRSLVETNTSPCDTLDELRSELQRLRRQLADAAEPLGLGVVAAGTVPLVGHRGTDISAGARYERMQHDYQMLVREQHICGAQVHVDVPNRDLAVAVVQHVAVHLPTFLALSASSPYWRGEDSGYASYRTLVWQRWPTAGPPGPMRSAAEYDRMVADLVASGTISDPGMVYFDVRPSAHLPTVELRICDACPSVDDVVLIAGLFRALVRRSASAVEAGTPLPGVRHELLRAATWRSARSGLEGDLVDLRGPALVPPATLVGGLVDSLRPELEQAGDWEQVLELSRAAVSRGSAAAQQRRVYGRRGELTDVVDSLLAQTQGRSTWPAPTSPPVAVPELLRGYRTAGFDEVVSRGGRVLASYGWLFRTLDRLGPRGLAAAASALVTEQRARGVTFRVGDDDHERLFPLDLVPRVLPAEDWAGLQDGLIQRVRGLESFLQDVYGPRQAMADGVLPAALTEHVPGWNPLGKLVPQPTVRAAVSGIDLVRDRADTWLVLEDNLRIPSGLGYAIACRRLIRSVLPDLEPPAGLVPLEGVPGQLLDTLLAALPPGVDADAVALLTAGPPDAAFYEHQLLAELMGVPLVTPSDLSVDERGVTATVEGGPRRLQVLYRRLDEQMLLGASGADGEPLGERMCAAVASGALRLVNPMGNGVADDKMVYAYVPDMISYYLGEKPLLDSVPTFPCLDPARREEVLDRLDELVLKPVDGYGGRGVVIGPHADATELAGVGEQIRAHPERWVAQEMVALSTHPTFEEERLEPRAVDLRAFVLFGDRPAVVPAALSRFAPRDSAIVNSSRGGGAKDTWILR